MYYYESPSPDKPYHEYRPVEDGPDVIIRQDSNLKVYSSEYVFRFDNFVMAVMIEASQASITELLKKITGQPVEIVPVTTAQKNEKEICMKYVIFGSLYEGVPFEDFFPEDKALPRVTISAEDSDMVPEGEEYVILPSEDDGWIDVAVKELTREIAIKVLGDHIGQPVEIVERGQVIAI